jgi:hypothetical protein
VTGLRGIADTTGSGDRNGTVSAGELIAFVGEQAKIAASRGASHPTPGLYGRWMEPLRTY